MRPLSRHPRTHNEPSLSEPTGEKLVELLVVADGQLEVPRDDAGLLVVPGGVSSQLEHLGGLKTKYLHSVA